MKLWILLAFDEFTAAPRKAVLPATHPKQLHFYVKYRETNLMRVYSVDSNERCTSSGEINLKDSSQWIRTIALDDNLYCLRYNRRNVEKVDNQAFYACNSIDMRSLLKLNAPPIIFGDVNLCRGQNNNIYVYHQTLFQPLIKTNSPCSKLFNDEEVSRSIYLYNADLDIWLPVPPMKEKVEDACMITNNGLIYLIGGTSNLPDHSSGKFIQAYDYREGIWQILESTKFDRVGAACSLLNNKIYISGGRSQATSVETYDPQNRMSECLGEKMNIEMQYHQLISYYDKLWAFGNFTPGSSSINSLSIQNYPNCIESTVECKGCTLAKYYCCARKYESDCCNYPSLSLNNYSDRRHNICYFTHQKHKI